jgi:hypothetical protein
MTDEWDSKKRLPLGHMDSLTWQEGHQAIRRLFTGGEDENGKTFNIKKDDASSSLKAHRMARGSVTIDFDSSLALFTDLSMIKSTIAISVVTSEVRNLKGSVHICHEGEPLHWIPHFHVGKFGHDPGFDLFILLPNHITGWNTYVFQN